ncbi:phosphate acetyltransferase [Sporolactobacillus spathodeae]|uniref:Phosphate acetyltransferase n=1 Tax=Sporolactobacillus spathodeae TaxID=1465502 RepID=A0ABS2QC05_9BACL|nr:phosphate acetyltransferase [Sporolactobacillus spathodeae]MBM7658497.1 phosphate acetyltransferase [Sporolactobacillus spathodeae]
MADLFSKLKEEVKAQKPSIVFPECDDERIICAVKKLAEEELIVPVLIGSKTAMDAEIRALADKDLLKLRDPQNEPEMPKLIQALVERRKGKTDAKQAAEWLNDPCYFGTMLVYMHEADGLVSGAAHSTADTVRPALQIIKAQPGKKRISGAFILVKGNEELVFADCGINISPDSETLAEITVESAETARSFGIDPCIAMLSFSTKGSARGPEVDKITHALAIVKAEHPELLVDGELQFDAAYVPAVGDKKAPGSPVAGKANVFIFPNIDAGNIGYKMVQRLGGYTAVGPILQGLNKPVNDLSRGCSADDVYKLALITAKQAIMALEHHHV